MQVQKTGRTIPRNLIIAVAVGAAILLLGLPLLFGGGDATDEPVTDEGGEYAEPPPTAPPPAMLTEERDTQ